MERHELANKSGDLVGTALQFRESAALLTAIKLDLFERIGLRPTPPERIAAKEDPDGLTRLCRALAGMDLLEKEGEHFSNSQHAEQLLTSRGSIDLRPIFDHFVDLYDMWCTLDEAINTGQKYKFESRNDDSFNKEFTRAMEARAQFSAEELADAIGDRLNGGRLLDLGGGSGVFARALLKEDPEATGVVADQPDPLAVAREYIEHDNLEDRLGTTELDLLEDEDYGDGFDVVLLSAILHIFGSEDAQTILNRTYDALGHGGIVIVRDYVIHDNQAGPLDGLLFDLLMYLATEEGQTYTETQLRQMMKGAGFESLNRVNLPRSTDDLLIGRRE